MFSMPKVYILFIEISTFVLTQTQYILIHQALLEHNQFGETEIPLPELHSTLSTLKQKGSGNEPTLMEDEFEAWDFFISFHFLHYLVTLKSMHYRGAEGATYIFFI